MPSAIPARRLQHSGKAETTSFPWPQLSILGMFPYPTGNAGPIYCRSNATACHYLTFSFHCLPIASQVTFGLTSTLSSSVMSHLRANRLHVHLPLRLLHGYILQRYLRHPPDCNLCWHGHLRIYFRRVLVRCGLGSDQRQGGKEAGPSCRTGRNSAEYAGIRGFSKSTSCVIRASLGRIAQWVRPPEA